MRGAVSKTTMLNFFNRGDLYREGAYCDYTMCYNSTAKHIIAANAAIYDVDVFLHCWNTDLERDMVGLYKPKAYLFEDNTAYADEITSLCGSGEEDFAGISQALTMKKSIEIKEQYERDNGISYDIVILYRYDVMLQKDIDLSTYDLDGRVYVNAHPGANGDFHFVMNNQLSSEFKYLYDSLGKGNPHKAHHWIQNYVVAIMGKTLQMDSIIPGQHQEVVRKLYLSPSYWENCRS